jgi:cytochrome c oxidase subunit 4
VELPQPADPGARRESAHAALPTAAYLLVWGLLVVLTAVTVGVTYLDMKRFAVIAALVIATVKASLVVLYFMHVRYESRLIAVVLIVGLAAFAVFMGLTFTDILYRYG